MDYFVENSALHSKGISSNIIYSYFLEQIAQLKSKNDCKTLIDIGCGRGDLISLIHKEHNFEQVTGADVINYTGNESFHYIKQDLNHNFAIKSHYDLTISSEVIEHLENPRHFLRELSMITSSGGHIILSTPNPTSLLSKLSFTLRGHHSNFGPSDYPAHITPVTPYQMRNMISEIVGLKLVKFIFIPNGRIPGSSLHWRSVFPFLKGSLFSDNYIVVLKKD